MNDFENWKHFFEVAPEANCQARSLRLNVIPWLPGGCGNGEAVATGQVRV